ncbi:Flp family type IVb pilin [Devosia sp. A449]
MLVETIKSFIGDEAGATVIEYALLGTLIAVAIAGTFAAVGNNLFVVMGAGTGGAADVIGDQAKKL